ncbi:hypothetical protein FB379_12211 [Aeribacillus composti]|nr:hypothetical protein FB379_12211 [Aeribacillus composti]
MISNSMIEYALTGEMDPILDVLFRYIDQLSLEPLM